MHLHAKQWHRHLGVYGVAINSKNELLVIIKNGGPYDGLHDLPGGSFANPESISECLKREFLEETGMQIQLNRSLGSFDVLTNTPFDGYPYTHHIALLYSVDILNTSKQPIDDYVEDCSGKTRNDSLGFKWMDIKTLTSKNASPLILKTLEILNSQHNFDIIKFYK